MNATSGCFDRLADDARRPVLIGALVGIAGTIAISTPTDINAGPVVLGAAVAGFLYGRGIDGGHRVGKWVGVIGSLTFAPIVPTVLGYSLPIVLVVVCLLAIVVTFTVLGGMLGGIVGGVARAKLERIRHSPVAA